MVGGIPEVVESSAELYLFSVRNQRIVGIDHDEVIADVTGRLSLCSRSAG